ncbi:MAG: hypothetical protein LBU90_10345 [Bacteroidales bacterium]|jgi:hypothetical protein|nr:hypothetical protein [Bacteroidales bacterium]
MVTTTTTQHAALLRKFHTLLAKTGVGTEGKEVILAAYGVHSSKELSTAHLADACQKLEQTFAPSEKQNEMDTLRKRVIAAIGAWLTAMNKEQNVAINKAVACRAAKREKFNDIPAQQLRSLYAAFCKAKKDLAQVESISAQELFQLSINN